MTVTRTNSELRRAAAYQPGCCRSSGFPSESESESESETLARLPVSLSQPDAAAARVTEHSDSLSHTDGLSVILPQGSLRLEFTVLKEVPVIIHIPTMPPSESRV